jgi:ethanolamine permease
MGGGRRSGRAVNDEDVHAAYLARRGLRRDARVLHLWALGVGAVISGEFHGWNLGLGAGGFGGLVCATARIAVMSFGLVDGDAPGTPPP